MGNLPNPTLPLRMPLVVPTLVPILLEILSNPDIYHSRTVRNINARKLWVTKGTKMRAGLSCEGVTAELSGFLSTEAIPRVLQPVVRVGVDLPPNIRVSGVKDLIGTTRSNEVKVLWGACRDDGISCPVTVLVRGFIGRCK